jgi:hypothetical protein
MQRRGCLLKAAVIGNSNKCLDTDRVYFLAFNA